MKLITFICILTIVCPFGFATPDQADACRQGSVLNQNGTALYGTAIEYTSDIYMGRLAHGATVELADTVVIKSEHNIPIIKVKVLADEGYGKSCIGRTGWITLKDTSFVDMYDPAAKKLDPARVTLSKKDNQIRINSIPEDKQGNKD
jgi:hypothetical protein